MKNEIEIRRLDDSDQNAWLDMWPDYVDTKIPPLETLNMAWSRIMDATVPMYAIGAYDKRSQKLIGFINYNLVHTTWYKGLECYIEDAYVLPEYRGKSVFAQMYEFIRDELVERGDCRIIYWRTSADNVSAQKAYDKLAYKTGWIRYEDRLFETTVDIDTFKRERSE